MYYENISKLRAKQQDLIDELVNVANQIKCFEQVIKNQNDMEMQQSMYKYIENKYPKEEIRYETVNKIIWVDKYNEILGRCNNHNYSFWIIDLSRYGYYRCTSVNHHYFSQHKFETIDECKDYCQQFINRLDFEQKDI